MASFLNDTYATSSVSSSQTERLCTFIPCPLFSPTVTYTIYLYRSSFFRARRAFLASTLSWRASASFQFSLSAYRYCFLAPSRSPSPDSAESSSSDSDSSSCAACYTLVLRYWCVLTSSGMSFSMAARASAGRNLVLKGGRI